MKLTKLTLSLIALSTIAIAAMPVSAQIDSYKNKTLPVETLLGLLDSKAYYSVSYTRMPLKLPPPEAQNQHIDLGAFDLYGQDLLSVVEMPPQIYEQFTGRLVNDCVSATGTVDGKSCLTTIAMFAKPLPKLSRFVTSDKDDLSVAFVKPDKQVLTWHKGSNDWYLTVLGERLLIISSDLKAVTDAAGNYKNNQINQIELLKDYKSLLTALAPHAQVDGSKDNCPPLVLQMDQNKTLTLRMPQTSLSNPTKQDWDKALHAFEQDTDVKLSESAPFVLTVPGDSAQQIKLQKCLMVECSPAIVHHFKVSR